MSEAAGGIHAKLVAVSTAVSGVPRRGWNIGQKYAYLRGEDVLDAVRKEFIVLGIATTFNVDRVEHTPRGDESRGSFLTTVWGTLTLVDTESGETLTLSGAGTGSDNGDKGLYKALSGCAKYILLKTFLIPADDDDPENDSGETTRATPVSSPTRSTNGSQRGSTGASDNSSDTSTVGLNDKQRNLVKAKLSAAGFKTTDKQREVLRAATGKYSTKQMTSADIDVLISKLEDQGFLAEFVFGDELVEAK